MNNQTLDHLAGNRKRLQLCKEKPQDPVLEGFEFLTLYTSANSLALRIMWLKVLILNH